MLLDAFIYMASRGIKKVCMGIGKKMPNFCAGEIVPIQKM